MPEELEVVERLEVGAMDDRGALRLDPERDPRAGEPRAVVRDERDVGHAPDADEPRLAAALAHPVADGVEHVAVVEPGDRLADRVRERRPDRDDDLGGVVARGRLSALRDHGAPPGSSPSEPPGATTCGSDCSSSQRSPSSR